MTEPADLTSPGVAPASVDPREPAPLVSSCDTLPTGILERGVCIDGSWLSLADFLLGCAQRVAGSAVDPQANPTLTKAQDAFLTSGLAALGTGSTWLQFGLQVAPERRGDAYAHLARLARELIDESAIVNFFFMHKPPGLRVRFEPEGGQRLRLREQILIRLSSWQEAGVLQDWVPGVYEPETYLFGGPTSMASVHRLFTVDSLAWLDHHVLANRDGEHAGPVWATSLLLLRALLDALSILGWEALDVWDRIRTQAGRRLDDKEPTQTNLSKLSRHLRRCWERPDDLLEQLPPLTIEIVHAYRQSLEPVAGRWLAEYFVTGDPHIGVREAAAYCTIFHWNRAGLPLRRQALLVESLLWHPMGDR
jgi:thiopeptide-type bacteriocin biosynthesis protein